MRVLGIADGQTSGAAIVEDGRIIAAVNEERIARIKLARGFPWKSIEEDAARAFLDSALDYLAIGNYLVAGPVGSVTTRKKWEGQSKWGHATHLATSR